jgi:hypothetical protein
LAVSSDFRPYGPDGFKPVGAVMARKITHLSGRGFSLVLVLCLVAALSFSFLGCPMDGDTSTSIPGLDDKLIGTWEFTGSYGTERYVINDRNDTFTYGSVYDGTFTESFSGTIVYAESFSDSAGVIIIKYTEGHKQEWSSWAEDSPGSNNWVETPLNPQPAGNFYGIYYVNLNDAGTTVFLANTSNLADYSYGPTETETLEAAKARFTETNINDYIDISVGEPQTKVD